MIKGLSRRDFLRESGLAALAGLLMISKALASGKKYVLPKTNEPLDGDVIREQERAAKCLNIDDEHCPYRGYGNCSGCNFNGDYALFITEDLP